MADEFDMPQERDFGWKLKGVETTDFQIVERDNGQFCAVLGHSLLRGVTSEMIYWWFKNFGNLAVILEDTPGFEGQSVPAYLLWHPSDHCSATLSGALAADGTAQAGAKIHIQEAMQFKSYGMKYPVNTALNIFYCAPDGWAMGRSIPIFGKAMCLRIHYRDVMEGDRIVGVHYHYEVVIGVSGNNAVARWINSKITADYSPEFFSAWHLHNTIEVGTFENFLPALFAQGENSADLRYSLEMNSLSDPQSVQTSFAPALFAKRVAGFKTAADPFAYQAPEEPSFL
ncbi:MAG: hypothetical protein AAFR64_11805 [Pseudomonadota bacterium]